MRLISDFCAIVCLPLQLASSHFLSRILLPPSFLSLRLCISLPLSISSSPYQSSPIIPLPLSFSHYLNWTSFFSSTPFSLIRTLRSPLSLIISIYPLLDFLTLSLSLDSSLTDLHVLSPILNHRRFRSLNFPLSQFPSLSLRDSSSSNSPSVLSPSRFSLLRFGLLSFSLFVSNFITFAFPHDLSFLILLLWSLFLSIFFLPHVLYFSSSYTFTYLFFLYLNFFLFSLYLSLACTLSLSLSLFLSLPEGSSSLSHLSLSFFTILLHFLLHFLFLSTPFVFFYC